MRIAFNICLIASILFFPWWVTAALIVAAAWFVPKCYEVILYGLLIDAFYGTEFGIHGFPYSFTAGSLAVFILASIIKKRVV